METSGMLVRCVCLTLLGCSEILSVDTSGSVILPEETLESFTLVDARTLGRVFSQGQAVMDTTVASNNTETATTDPPPVGSTPPPLLPDRTSSHAAPTSRPTGATRAAPTSSASDHSLATTTASQQPTESSGASQSSGTARSTARHMTTLKAGSASLSRSCIHLLLPAISALICGFTELNV